MITAKKARKMSQNVTIKRDNEILERFLTASSKLITIAAEKGQRRTTITLGAAEFTIYPELGNDLKAGLEAIGFEVIFHPAEQGDCREPMDYGVSAHLEVKW